MDTANDPWNCGGCIVACPELAGATHTCVDGKCGFSCLSGYADCNGDAADMCETITYNNVSNCGVCGRSCPPGVACSISTCEPEVMLAEPVAVGGVFTDARPSAIAVDDRFVYMSSDYGGPQGLGTIRRIYKPLPGLTYPIADCQSAWNGHPTVHRPRGIAIDATTVYWLNDPYGGGASSTIAKKSITGGNASEIVGPGTVRPDESMLRSNTSALFWLANGILSASKTATGTSTKVTSLSYSFHVDDKNLFWVNESYRPVMANIDGTSPVPIGTGTISSTGGMTGDASNLYAVSGSKIMKIPRNGASISVLTDDAGCEIHGISLVIDSASIYWSAKCIKTAHIAKATLSGGSPVVIADPGPIADGGGSPTPIAIDEQYIYWGSSSKQSDGTILAGVSRTFK